jgi:Sortase and related acyltransferases
MKESKIENSAPLTVIRQIGQKRDDVEDCYFRKCVYGDTLTIVNIQSKVIEELANAHSQNLFIPTKPDEIERLLQREQDAIYFICVQTPDGICAYSCTIFDEKCDASLSPHFESKRVATFDSVVVLPDFRGNALQSKLLKISEEKAKEEGYDIIASMVSPKNTHSMDNFIKEGFKVFDTITYGEQKLDRCIVFKNLIH